MKKILSAVTLAVVLMALTLTASAVTVKELTDSKVSLDQKMEIAGLLSLGKQAQADSLFNVAQAGLIKAEAAAELKKLRSQAMTQFWDMVVGYIKPISTVPAVLDSMPSFFKTKKLSADQQHLVVNMLSERYKLASGDCKIDPQSRIKLMKAAFTAREQFRADVRSEVAKSGIHQMKTELSQLGHDYSVMAGDYSRLSAMVDTMSNNQMAMLEVMANHEARLDSVTTELVVMKTAIQKNRFDINAALSVMEQIPPARKLLAAQRK